MSRGRRARGSSTRRALSVLETVAQASQPLSLTELMQASGLPKPTVYRLLVQLEDAGMLAREPNGKRYTIGPRLSALALDIILNSPQRAARHAILQRLVEEIGETCNLTMLDGSEVVYLDRVETAWPLRLHLQPRSRVPLHCTASGKLFLSQLSAEQRGQLLGSARLKRFTEHTITDAGALEQELQRIRDLEVATDDEEYLAGMVCVAVPVRTADGRMCAAVALHAPVARMSLERGLQHVPTLRRAATALARTYRADHVERDGDALPTSGIRGKARALKKSQSKRTRQRPASRARAAARRPRGTHVRRV